MALLHCDSLGDDRGINFIGDRYEFSRLSPGTGNEAITLGRTGNGTILSSNQADGPFPSILEKQFSSRQVVTVGHGTKSVRSTALCSIRDNGANTPQLFTYYNSDGTISVWRGDFGEELARSTDVFSEDEFFYIELYGKIHPSAGKFVVRIDGDVLLSAVGLNTSESGNAYGDACRLTVSLDAGEYANRVVDDLYITDDDDTVPGQETLVDLLGPIHIDAQVASADGVINDWIASAGGRAGCVDETSGENGNTDYVSSKVLNAKQLFNMGNLPFSQRDIDRIVGTAQHSWISRADVIYREVQNLIRTNAALFEGSTLGAPYGEYQRLMQAYGQNPSTLRDWLVNEVNTSQCGLKVSV